MASSDLLSRRDTLRLALGGALLLAAGPAAAQKPPAGSASARLARIGALVHYLDAGGIPVPEAAGLETVLAGLRALHSDDDTLLAAALAVFDALLAAPSSASESTSA